MTGTGPDPAGQRVAASAAAQHASRILLAHQDSGGWWTGSCAADVALDAEGLLAREVLGIRTAELTSAAAQHIRSLQQADGSWTGVVEPAADGGIEAGQSGGLSASVLAYLALRLAGDSPDAYHMAVAAGWIRDAGGLTEAGLVTHAWLATLGITGWEELPVPAPEMIFLPVRYAAARPDWAAWGRPAVVALGILGSLRPVRRLPIDLAELRSGAANRVAPATVRHRLPGLNLAQTAALRKSGQWLADWQQRPGLPGSRRPAWPLALVALHLLGYSLRHPVLANGLTWLDTVTAQPRPPAGVTRPEPAPRPSVQDTALAIEALADAGLAADDPALAAAGRWLLLQRIEGPAGGLGLPAGPAPAGWSFGRDGYPAAADTARVLSALSRVELPGLTGRPAIRAAIRWLTGTQDRDGSWSGSTLVTALVLRALASHGAPDARAIRRAVVWLLREQRPDGSWPGRAAQGDLRATAAVLPALLIAGVLPGKPAVAGAVGWLLSRQNLDAGFDVAGRRPGRSGPDGTASGLIALLAASGPETSDPVDLAADWLVQAQLADGGWPGPAGRTGGRKAARGRGLLVPGLLLPLSALGQYAAADRHAGPRTATSESAFSIRSGTSSTISIAADL